MSGLVGVAARPFLDPAAAGAEPWRAHEARAALEPELTSARRIGLGAAALVLAGVAGLAIAVAWGPDADGAIRVGGSIVAALALAGAAVAGTAVVRAGERVLRAYAAWSSIDGGSAARPGDLVTRLFSGRGVLRSALAAAALIGALFSLTLGWLGIAAGDPGDLGPGRGALGVAGLVWGLALALATWFLVAGEIRAGLAASGRVVRARR